ncbi:alpha-amylase family glycosyl hydrolase [Flavobacterium myungsuense]|uniref:Alpha-amylase family glycosyl hydrolase n=1 Tax=Flavobacterium myungsuense TaxID=651823 RepID=A0ABW3J058_9FLAO
MKKIILLSCFLLTDFFGFAQVTTAVATVNPVLFEENQQVTISFKLTNPVTTDLYLWAWAQDANGANIGTPNNGAWTSSSASSKLIQTGSSTYAFTYTPSVYYNTTGIAKIGVLAKTLNGSAKSIDFLFNVGAFQVDLVSPTVANTNQIIDSGTGFTVEASNTGGNANYVLKANGTEINSSNDVSSYSFPLTNLTENTFYSLTISQGTKVVVKKFSVIINATPELENQPLNTEDGVNYSSDDTKVTLVLNAPLKDFVYIAGSFNNWNPTANYLMKKDPVTGKFWITINELTPEQVYTFQYWVVDNTNRPVNSPSLVKTADPFSTLVLNNYDDPEIKALGVYPNLPDYPAGQDRDVTVVQTGTNTFRSYTWTNSFAPFVKPAKEKLIIYEALVRDFDVNKTYQDLIDRIEYLKGLNINAIQLMPVMEFEGNESWGYNTSYHLALDKRYGPPAKLKELIDLCHQNGIAVILDVVPNHVFGRSPIERMWMTDTDNDGWSNGVTSENPYTNQIAKHSYSVGTDLNHQSPLTQYYMNRIQKQWINEFKIDGFRWDLTKGVTQNCTPSDQNCTNRYQQDRVDVLKKYVDYSWELDPNHYAIFEHLGASNEEQQWANYKIAEGKGVMMWSEQFAPYTQLIEGNGGNKNISGMLNTSKGFTGRRVIGYPESHDKDRLMFQARQYGASAEIKSLNGALKRMASIAAISTPIPGPKMLWQFAELGWDSSIYTCPDGSVNDESNTRPGDCKLYTKHVKQWTENWMAVPERKALYDTYARINALKINEPVFNGSVTLNSGNFTPSIYIFDNSITEANTIKNVVILSNFSTTSQNITGNFPYVGTWYNLMDNSSFEVVTTTDKITIESGGFRMFGNKPSTLSRTNFDASTQIQLHPNPTSKYFTLNTNVNKVQIFSVTGQLVKTFAKNLKDNQFEIGELIKGIYLVKVVNENNSIKSFKLIKQ